MTVFICDRLLYFSAPWLPVTTARSLSANAKLRRVFKAPDSHEWVFKEGIRYAKAGVITDNYRADTFGYRNPQGYLERHGRADILLIGDSMVWGTEDKSIADYLRKKLYPATVYSCGIGGEGIPQWAYHYKRFVSLVQSPPPIVVLNFSSPTDIYDLRQWRKIKKRFGSVHAAAYFAYSQDDTWHQVGLSWWERNLTLMELRSLWKSFKANLFPDNGSDSSLAELHDGYPPSQFYIRHEPSPELLRDELAEAIGEVVTQIRQANPQTIIIFSYIPSSGALYGPAIRNCADCKRDVVNQSLISEWLRALSVSLEIAYVDVTPELQRVAATEILWHSAHFNAQGYELYARFLGNEIENVMQEGSPPPGAPAETAANLQPEGSPSN